jgi:hypothetical protein
MMRYFILFCIILTILTFPVRVFSSPLQDATIIKAKSFVGTTEKTGNNDGPVVEEILRYIGLKKGNPYCMATVVYSYHLGAQEVGIKDQLPKYGRVSAFWNYVKANPFKYQIIPVSALKLGTQRLQPGDILIFSRSPDNISNFNGHTGITLIQLDNLLCSAFEGNTGGGKDQGEGDGIWIKKRSIAGKNGNLKLRGFVRIK